MFNVILKKYTKILNLIDFKIYIPQILIWGVVLEIFKKFRKCLCFKKSIQIEFYWKHIYFYFLIRFSIFEIELFHFLWWKVKIHEYFCGNVIDLFQFWKKFLKIPIYNEI